MPFYSLRQLGYFPVSAEPAHDMQLVIPSFRGYHDDINIRVKFREFKSKDGKVTRKLYPADEADMEKYGVFTFLSSPHDPTRRSGINRLTSRHATWVFFHQSKYQKENPTP
jgi:hypothetical protein